MAAKNSEPPHKKRKTVARRRFETIASQPILELLPDNIILTIMNYLDVTSLVQLSRVCRRFYHLYTDESVWSDVDLTTIASRLDVRKLKKIIHERLPGSLIGIRLASTKKQFVTGVALDELFDRCPNIRAITLKGCDLTQLPSTCKLFHNPTLEHVSIVNCTIGFRWMEAVQVSWPKLTHLSLAGSVKLSNFDIQYMADCKPWATSLKSLDISGCYRISELGLKTVCTSFENLKSLSVSRLPFNDVNSEKMIEHIASLKQLKHLSIVQIPLSLETHARLPKLFPHLNSLYLSETTGSKTDITTLMPNTKVVYAKN